MCIIFPILVVYYPRRPELEEYITRSIQRTQTPPRLWPLTLSCDLDLWPKVTNFNKVQACAVSNHLAKTASKSVHPLDWNFIHKQSRTDTHTDKLQWKYNPSTIFFHVVCLSLRLNWRYISQASVETCAFSESFLFPSFIYLL